MYSSPAASGNSEDTTSTARSPCTARKHQSSCRTTSASTASSSRMAWTRSVLAAFGTTKYCCSPSRYTMRSSTIPPRSFSTVLYCARPRATLATSLVTVRWRVSSAPGPDTITFPRCMRSNRPTRSRTAWCSARVPRYSMGMAQPANAPILAPRARCSSSSGVRFRATAPASVTERNPSGPGLRAAAHPGGTMHSHLRRRHLHMAENSYDLAILGAGTGGYACALRAAELGKRVALIERDDRLGGTCLLRGCIPTKALLQSAAVLDSVNRSEEWGIKASGEPDWDGVLAFQRKIVEKKVAGLTGLIKARKIEVGHGTGKLAPRP